MCGEGKGGGGYGRGGEGDVWEAGVWEWMAEMDGGEAKVVTMWVKA